MCVGKDWRNIENGYVISASEDYCDQPYVVITDDGNWLCVMTTGKSEEGSQSQHIVSTISTDKGRTWSVPVDIEPPGPPEASWAMPLKVPYGRVYVFYTYNGDNLREIEADNEDARKRVDGLGYLMFKYSDNNGKTWSQERRAVPMRLFRIDRENPYQGKVLFFWGVGKPVVADSSVYMGLSKIGRCGEGFAAQSEGFFLKSDNILTQREPEKIQWETLPDGDEGLRAPDGPIAEEHNLVVMKSGALYCTYRTTRGHNCHAYSRDGGHAWTPPAYATYTPGGRKIKHPRAANFVRKFSNGKYVLWYHNHSGKSYSHRNPAWLCGGIEKDGFINWTQPEIALYHDDFPNVRISYPDFIEDEGEIFITETQKSVARAHKMDRNLLNGLWNQLDNRNVAQEGLVLELRRGQCEAASTAAMPELGNLSGGKGFSIDFRVNFERLSGGQIILDTRRRDGRGIHVGTTEAGTIRITLNDGRTESSWDCDRGILKTGIWHHVAIIVDGGPKIITFVIDGELCDGGEIRQFGWGRFNGIMEDVNGKSTLEIAGRLDGQIAILRIYDRYLRTSEAVGNFRAGM